jgi:putative tryptophan/tyrosine transport system substrate-binding protein
MKRREFISLLGGGAVVWPLATRAQQGAMPMIGFLSPASPDGYARFVAGFRHGLNRVGYMEGRNVAIEFRWAEGQFDRLPALAADLVRRQVMVICAHGPAVLPAKAATTTIPIVFVTGSDPVEVGLVASLNRPGGNLTGVATLYGELGPKQLELLHELIPSAAIIALLINPTNSAFTEPLSRELQVAARTLGVKVHVVHASSDHDLDTVFVKLAQLRAGGLVIGNDAFFTSRIEQLAALTVRHAVPTIYQLHEFVAAGGLMSYGGNLTDLFHEVGVYTGRILKGEKPADLPVQQSTKLKLTINLKTAKALGLEVPATLLGRADEVIE